LLLLAIVAPVGYSFREKGITGITMSRDAPHNGDERNPLAHAIAGRNRTPRSRAAIRVSQIGYSDHMDHHLDVLREKIVRLRSEIADIRTLNEQYRREDSNEPDAEVAHNQRLERLEAIQRELAQLAELGLKVRSVEEMKEKHRSRIHLVRKAS
jgi:hypothetical protein